MTPAVPAQAPSSATVRLAVAIDRADASAADVERSSASLAAAGVEPRHVIAHLPSGGVPAALDASDRTHLLWIRAGAELAPTAIADIVAGLERFPRSALVYADAPALRRPDFSPLLLRSLDYLGAVRVFDLQSLRSVDALAEGVGALEVWEAGLRLARAGAEVLHLSEPLTSREPRPGPTDAASVVAMLAGELSACGLDAMIEPGPGGAASIEYHSSRRPKVSIVIPTRGSSAEVWGRSRVLVVEAVRSVIERSTYTEIEFVVVADADTPPGVLEDLAVLAGERLTIVPWTAPFNFSAKMNRGAVHATGEYLLLLNDDVEVIAADWIERMLALAVQRGIGLVGAHLYFEDGTLQHAGHVYRRGEPTHAAIGWSDDRSDPIGSIRFDREVSGATAACAMLSAETYRAVGGMSTLLPGNYNDVDLCMKVRARGLRTVVTPGARLHHFESKTRDATVTDVELDIVRGRWGAWLEREAFWTGEGV